VNHIQLHVGSEGIGINLQDNGVQLACSLLVHLSLISKKEWQKDVLLVVYENFAILVHSCDLECLVKLSQAVLEDTAGGEAIAGALQNQVRLWKI
jgi:hypothetical protein